MSAREPAPFFKWDPDGAHARERRHVRALIRGEDPARAERQHVRRTGRDPLAGKKWLLRWAWLVSTGVIVFGYLVLVLLLADKWPLAA